MVSTAKCHKSEPPKDCTRGTDCRKNWGYFGILTNCCTNWRPKALISIGIGAPQSLEEWRNNWDVFKTINQRSRNGGFLKWGYPQIIQIRSFYYWSIYWKPKVLGIPRCKKTPIYVYQDNMLGLVPCCSGYHVHLPGIVPECSCVMVKNPSSNKVSSR